MPRAYADSLAIENRRQSVRVHIDHREADDAATLPCRRSVDVETLDRGEALLCCRHQRALVRENAIHSDVVEILDGGGEPNRVGSIGSSRLELVRQHIPRRASIAAE